MEKDKKVIIRILVLISGLLSGFLSVITLNMYKQKNFIGFFMALITLIYFFILSYRFGREIDD